MKKNGQNQRQMKINGKHPDKKEYTWWDMRSINNQEFAPGLYIFHVSSNDGNYGEPFIGKFAVIR